MEIIVKTIEADNGVIILPNDEKQTMLVCHSDSPWHHLRIYTQEQWENVLGNLYDDQVNPRTISKIVGEPIASFLPDQPIIIDPVYLNMVSVNGEANQSFVCIKDGDRMVQLWDERTAPKDISDKSIGRVRTLGRKN